MQNLNPRFLLFCGIHFLLISFIHSSPVSQEIDIPPIRSLPSESAHTIVPRAPQNFPAFLSDWPIFQNFLARRPRPIEFPIFEDSFPVGTQVTTPKRADSAYTYSQCGTQLGYVVLEYRLGVGADGSVWTGMIQYLDAHLRPQWKRVAIKRSNGANGVETAFLTREIQSQHVINVWEYFFVRVPRRPGESSQVSPVESFQVMPQMKAELQKLLDLGHRFNLNTAYWEILRGLRDIHAAGIVHLDLKPGNVMVTNDGHMQIIDLDRAIKVGHINEVTYTGTPGYVAPEPFRLLQYDYWKADVFSAGMTYLAMAEPERMKRDYYLQKLWKALIQVRQTNSGRLLVDLDRHTVYQILTQALGDRWNPPMRQLLSKVLCKEDQRLTLEQFYQQFCRYSGLAV